MNNIIFNTELIKGAKGDTGDTGLSYEVPTGAVIAYDGTGVPEGYIETAEPLPPVPSGGAEWNAIILSTSSNQAGAHLSSNGWYNMGSNYAAHILIGEGQTMTMYGHDKFEVNLHIKTPETMPSSQLYILGSGNNQCSNSIMINANGTVTFQIRTTNITTTATLSADTEYLINFVVDVENGSYAYTIKSGDTVIETDTQSITVSYNNAATNWQIFSNNGYLIFYGAALYLPESYLKLDNTLVWGTEPQA